MREGSLLIPDDGAVNERERKKLHLLENVVVVHQTKPFLADLNFSFFFFSWQGEYALTIVCRFPLGSISISMLLQIR